LIEADDRLAVDERYRCALITQVDQFFQSGLVRAYIFLYEWNALLR
jgi:hypothetical protein